MIEKLLTFNNFSVLEAMRNALHESEEAKKNGKFENFYFFDLQLFKHES